MNTLGLWFAIEIDDAARGTDGCARITVSAGKSAATSSTSIGSDSRSLMPRPPGRPAPILVWPLWNRAGTPSDSGVRPQWNGHGL